MKVMDTTKKYKNGNDNNPLDLFQTMAMMLYNMYMEMTTPYMRMMIGCVVGLITVTKLNLFAFNFFFYSPLSLRWIKIFYPDF